MFHLDLFLKFIAAFAALVNPIYGIPIFLGMTAGYTPAERRRIATIIAVTIFVMAVVVTLIGEEILAFFGISVPAFQIAGGIIVLGIGLSMIKDDAPTVGDSKAAADGHQRRSNIAIVPLSIPLTFGPGAFATIVLFAHLLDDISEVATMIPVIVVVSFCVWIGLFFADPIARYLGNTVISVVARIMGIVLTAVAIEMIVSGAVEIVHDNFPGLASAATGS
jgi:MarC family membrane protein